MKCALCGKQEKSNPDVESGWRGIEMDGVFFYVCPNELPPNGSTAKEYKKAYTRVLEILIKKWRDLH